MTDDDFDAALQQTCSTSDGPAAPTDRRSDPARRRAGAC